MPEGQRHTEKKLGKVYLSKIAIGAMWGMLKYFLQSEKILFHFTSHTHTHIHTKLLRVLWCICFLRQNMLFIYLCFIYCPVKLSTLIEVESMLRIQTRKNTHGSECNTQSSIITHEQQKCL